MTKTEMRINRQQERLMDEISTVDTVDEIDLINWIKGYQGIGGQARVAEAVAAGQIVHVREYIYRVTATSHE